MKIQEKTITVPVKVRRALEKKGYKVTYLKERFKDENYYFEYTFERQIKRKFFGKKTQVVNIVFRKSLDLTLEGETTSNMIIDKITKR